MNTKPDRNRNRKRCNRHRNQPFTLRRCIGAVCGLLLIALLTIAFLLSEPSGSEIRTILDSPALSAVFHFIRRHWARLIAVLALMIGLVLALQRFLQKRKKKYPEFWGVVEIGNESYLIIHEDGDLPEKRCRVFCDGHTEPVAGSGK